MDINSFMPLSEIWLSLWWVSGILQSLNHTYDRHLLRYTQLAQPLSTSVPRSWEQVCLSGRI